MEYLSGETEYLSGATDYLVWTAPDLFRDARYPVATGGNHLYTVQYTYAKATAGRHTIRRTGMTLPSGKVLVRTQTSPRDPRNPACASGPLCYDAEMVALAPNHSDSLAGSAQRTMPGGDPRVKRSEQRTLRDYCDSIADEWQRSDCKEVLQQMLRRTRNAIKHHCGGVPEFLNENPWPWVEKYEWELRP